MIGRAGKCPVVNVSPTGAVCDAPASAKTRCASIAIRRGTNVAEIRTVKRFL